MEILDKVKSWNGRRILVIGEALIDKYIKGFADKISPDAPVPNIKTEENLSYLGGIGLVLKFIKSLGGIPEVCTIIGNDYEGDFFLKKIKEFNIEASGIIMDDNIATPQITRIKAMNQHVLRLETDYSSDFSDSLIRKFLKIIETRSKELEAILILDYGMGDLFEDIFIQKLINILKEAYINVPIITRPNLTNYYMYENVDLIKMTLQKALRTLSIDCCNETSVSIVAKKILNTTKCKNVLLNDIESVSYLYSKDSERLEKIESILKQPVRSYVAVGSSIMAILGLNYASNISSLDATKLALYGATLSATLPPVEFYNSAKLIKFISTNLNE
ncbi:MAG: bifunctional heptose 7-phosphate kinase/heptose 1-phosphate adenyltransferase [Promethearchaeota archaeon]